MFDLKLTIKNIDKDVHLKSDNNCIILVGEVGSGKSSVCERLSDFARYISLDPFMLGKYAVNVMQDDFATQKFKEYIEPFIGKVETISTDGFWISVGNKQLSEYSSGQKKIIHFFFTLCYILYCNDVKLSLIVDDIDSNLSIDYQKMLSEILEKAIVENPNHNFLFTTHSPFIFDKLIKYTVDISKLYVEKV